MSPYRRSEFAFGNEFQAYLHANGVPNAAGTYTTWLNRATRRIGERISPDLVGRASQVEPLISRIKTLERREPTGLLKSGTPDERHLRSVLRKYVGMVQSNFRGLFDNIPGEPTPPANDLNIDQVPTGTWTHTYRIVRDTAMAVEVKRLYEFRCQICDTRLEREPGVYYAEAHHLRPLGGQHRGPDDRRNLVCVCPNCHVLLDYNASRIDVKKLKQLRHEIGPEFLTYHNNRCVQATRDCSKRQPSVNS